MSRTPSGYLHELAEPFRFDGSSGQGIVLLHGWTGTPAHLRLLGASLNQREHTVVAPLYPGHGTAVEDMLDTGWRDWVRGAAEACQAIIDEGLRLHLAGLSMGGIISLLLAPHFEAASVSTINAPIRLRSRIAGLATILKRIQPVRPGVPDPPEHELLAEHYHQYLETPVAVAEDLFVLVRTVRRNLHRVMAPTLVIQSRVDETVRPDSGQIIYDGLGSARKRLVWLERSRHVATLDEERHVIDREVADWVEAS